MKHYRMNDIREILSTRRLLFPLDVALVGATGVGKSSTINGLFGSEVAKVGYGVDPETQNTDMYKINDVFRVHDSAGLGDGLAADKKHVKNLTGLLLKTCTVEDKEYGFIDLVLVILDGSGRDMGTTYRLLEQVVLDCVDASRVVVAINQADMAMKGKFWDKTRRKPLPELEQFLREKSQSIQLRLKEATGITIKAPVYYSAEFGYNLDVLMNHIIKHLPHERRVISF